MFGVLFQKGRTVELALAQCVIGAKVRPQKHQRKCGKKKLGPVKRNLVMVCLSWRIQPQFFSLPIYIIVSLFRVSLLWGERLFTEGLLPICWDNKSSSKLRDVALYMCGHMIKPHCLLSSKMKVASLLFSNTNIDFQRISLHRLPVAKSFLSKPGKCILFSYSLHSAVKKKHH